MTFRNSKDFFFLQGYDFEEEMVCFPFFRDIQGGKSLAEQKHDYCYKNTPWHHNMVSGRQTYGYYETEDLAMKVEDRRRKME